MSAIDLDVITGSECTEGVTRDDVFQPCDKPAVALRVDPVFGDAYRVCARHARTAHLMVPLTDLVAQVAERIALAIEDEADHIYPRSREGFALQRGTRIAATIARQAVR